MPIISEKSFTARILIVDDNPTVHEAFSEILKARDSNRELDEHEALIFGEAGANVQLPDPGYSVDHVISGKEAIEKIRQSVELEDPYQVAFVDVRMPGIDGVETIGRLWKLDPRIQAVICTAYADYEWQDLTRLFGTTDRLLVLKKPFQNIEVMQMASTLAQKWFLGRQAAMKMDQMEGLVARRTQKLIEFHRREYERIHELDQSRLQYALRLAQDFCGPLTLILNPVEEMLDGAAATTSRLELVHQNVKSLLKLAESSSMMQRLEEDDSKLNLTPIDLAAFMKGVLHGFIPGADERGIELYYEEDLEAGVIRTDSDKLEKALFNLLSALLKSAVDHSQIKAKLISKGELHRIAIEADLLPATRAATNRQESKRRRGDEGLQTDLEISFLFTQHLLVSLGGKLSMESDVKSGNAKRQRACLILELPHSRPMIRPSASPTASTQESVMDRETEDEGLPEILLFMEDDELRAFVSQSLNEDCRVSEVLALGAVLVSARASIPDVVIIDVDKSHGDPLQICMELKNDSITSHIPVILIGAEFPDSKRVAALDAGVDDCLVKPFRMPLLKARVKNLLETRLKLHEYFKDLGTVQPRELASTRKEAEFLGRVVEVVEQHLADYEFDVETLARQLGVSRRQLFRKFKAVAGCTPNTYIRDLRLKRAARMLVESQCTVSEIIYAVGFSDPKYFRTVFRERYGVLPGEYGKTLPKTQK